jgi:hypothetical protein
MSCVYSTIPNYGGRQPTNTSYIKQFTTTIQQFVPYIVKTVGGIITLFFSLNTVFSKDVTVLGNFSTPSDGKIKTNIEPIHQKDLDTFMNLEPVHYSLKSDPTQAIHYGLVAQDVESFFPNLVSENKTLQYKTIHYIELIPLLVAKIQSLQRQIERELSEKT